MLMKIPKFHIITVILFLYYIKPTLGTKKLIDHPNYNEIISSICFSNPNSKICRHLKLKAASKLTDKPYETDNVIQSQLKSNSYDRTLVKNRPPHSNNFRKRSTDPLKIIELSDSFPQLIVNNTAENEWINTSTGTFQTFANMFNRIDVPSADIIEKDIDKDVEKDADLSSSYFIGIPSNSTSFNADDESVLNVDSSSSFNEASENNNAVNYYQSVNNAFDLESRRLSDQAKLIEDIVKKKLDLSTSSPTVPLEFKKDPPDWVFSSPSGDKAKTSPDFKDFSSGDAVVDFVLPSNTHDNNNPPGWIFSPPEIVTQYKLNSKLSDESDKEKFSKWMIPGGNIYPLNDLQLEAELVDNAKDYETQFNGEKNSVLFYNDDNERASIGEEDRPYPKSNHQTFSLSRESQLEDRDELLHKREERFINLRNLRNFIMKKYVSSNNNRVVTEKNKRRSVTKGSNIKANNTKEAFDLKSGIIRTKIDNSSPSVNHTHSFSPISEDYSSIKSNKTICSVKNSTNNKWNKIGMKSEPTLTSKDLKSNHTLRFVNSSEVLKSFVNNQSEKPNYKAFVLINNRDYPKISSVEGSSIEQLLKASDDTHKLNLSDESYVILRSKELQRMKNVLLDNFKQMIVNSEKKSSDTDTSTCYYPWELSTVETVSTNTPESTSEGCTENGQSLSTSEGMEVVTVSATISQEADSTSTNPQDTSPFSPSQPTSSQDEQDNSKQSQPFADLSPSTESQISPGTTRQEPDQSLPSINDLNDSNNNNNNNLGCEVQDSFTEGLYFLMPAQSVNAIKCALENSRKIYMGSSITGKFIASIESPNMAAKEKFSNNPLSMNFNSSNDTILQQTIEHILRNKKNGEVELRQLQGFINKGQNAVKESVKKGEIII